MGPAKLTVQALRIEQDLAANRLRGIPVDNDGHFLAPRRWNHNEPTDFLDLRSTSLFAKFEAEPVDGLTLDVSARHIDPDETQQYHEPFLLDASNQRVDVNGDGITDGISREFRDQYRASNIWSFGGNAVWSHAFSDTVTNRVLAGFDYSTDDSTSLAASLRGRATASAGRPCPLTFFDPVYRACSSASYAMPAQTRTLTETKRYGFYALNELTIGQVTLTAGIRTDTFDDISTAGNGAATRFKGSDESYRVGAVLAGARRPVAVRPICHELRTAIGVGAGPARGRPLAPTTGDMFEGGVKTALFAGRVQSSLSAYRIKRQNLLQADPDGDTNTLLTGSTI